MHTATPVAGHEGESQSKATRILDSRRQKMHKVSKTEKESLFVCSVSKGREDKGVRWREDGVTLRTGMMLYWLKGFSTPPWLEMRGLSPEPWLDKRGLRPWCACRGLSPCCACRGLSPWCACRGLNPWCACRGDSVGSATRRQS
eukprot:1283891-Rhodomonas_salina.1